MDLKKLGEASELLNDLSPLQPGTMGTYMDVGFTLLGRIKVVYAQGMWSEWYALFDDGREGWLTVAQGFYMMSFEMKDFPANSIGEIQVGQKIDYRDYTYRVDDVRNVTYAASEGELPFIFEKGFKAKSSDARAGRNFLSILDGPQGRQVFHGGYMDFDNFKFEFLRDLDW